MDLLRLLGDIAIFFFFGPIFLRKISDSFYESLGNLARVPQISRAFGASHETLANFVRLDQITGKFILAHETLWLLPRDDGQSHANQPGKSCEISATLRRRLLTLSLHSNLC